MKKIIAMFLAFSLSTFSLNLFAKERKGAELVVELRDGQQVRGELITIKKDALLLLNPEGADIGVNIDDIREIKVLKKSKALLGVGFGFLVGGSSGVLIGLAMGDTEQSEGFDPTMFWETAEFKALLFGLLGGMLGAVIGGTIGASAGASETIQLEGKSEAEIKEILVDLHKKARVRDYQ